MSRIDISYRRILAIVWPVLVSSLSFTAMGIIDTVMVGRLGVGALAAVGVAHFLAWWLFSFFWGLLSGISTLVSQADGADRPADAGVAFWHGLYLALGATVVLLACIPLVPAMLRLTGAPASVQALAGDYLVIRLWGGFAFALMQVAENVYRGLGETRAPMVSGIAQAVLDCAFNYVLIFGHFGAPAMGVEGAALGTVLAQGLTSAALLASVFLRRRFAPLQLARTWRPRARRFAALCRVSVPVAFQVFVELSGLAIFTALVARLGETEMAATNVVIQAWSVAFMAAAALSVAATTLVGQSVGAGVPEEGRRAVRRILVLGYALSAAMAVVYLLWPEALMAAFVQPSEIERLAPFARPLFWVVVLCLIPDLLFNVLSGALRGAGDTDYCLWTNSASTWLVFVPSVYLAVEHVGLVGAWACFVLHSACMAVLLEIRMRGDRWMRPPILDDDPDRLPIELALPSASAERPGA